MQNPYKTESGKLLKPLDMVGTHFWIDMGKGWKEITDDIEVNGSCVVIPANNKKIIGQIFRIGVLNNGTFYGHNVKESLQKFAGINLTIEFGHILDKKKV